MKRFAVIDSLEAADVDHSFGGPLLDLLGHKTQMHRAAALVFVRIDVLAIISLTNLGDVSLEPAVREHERGKRRIAGGGTSNAKHAAQHFIKAALFRLLCRKLVLVVLIDQSGIVRIGDIGPRR
jgi:hypothetical protein